MLRWIKKKKKRLVLKTVNDRTHGINYTVNSKQLWNYKLCLVKTFLLTMPWCLWHSPVIPVGVILLERRNFFSKKSLSKKSCLPGRLYETSCSNGLCHVLPGARARNYEIEEEVREKKESCEEEKLQAWSWHRQKADSSRRELWPNRDSPGSEPTSSRPGAE